MSHLNATPTAAGAPMREPTATSPSARAGSVGAPRNSTGSMVDPRSLEEQRRIGTLHPANDGEVMAALARANLAAPEDGHDDVEVIDMDAQAAAVERQMQKDQLRQEQQARARQQQAAGGGAAAGDNGAGGGGAAGGRRLPPPPPANETEWHFMPVDRVLQQLNLDDTLLADGLTDPLQVERSRLQHGDNKIPMPEGRQWWQILIANFANVITLILGAVVGVSAWLGDYAEVGVVIFVILFNGLLGYFQEAGAEGAARELSKMTAGEASVRRNGQFVVIDIDDVVIGDIVVLQQGGLVPADLRIVESHNLAVAEDILTGEPLPVQKQPGALERINNGTQMAVGDRTNMAFRQTTVVSGTGVGIAVAVGTGTVLGEITAKLSDDENTDNETPLQKSMNKLMWVLFGCCAIIVIIVFAANGWSGEGPVILYACAIGIAVLPESLLAVITVAMTVSMKRMADLKCIVRKLNALEVLASVDQICSDKTGTLTTNKMSVRYTLVGFETLIKVDALPRMSAAKMWVSGTQDEFVPAVELERSELFLHFCRAAALNASTQLVRNEDTGALSGTGNPSEIAIQTFCWQSSLPQCVLIDDHQYLARGSFPFDSTTKMMTVGFCRHTPGQGIGAESHVFVKGAPERVMARCSMAMMKDGTLVRFTNEIRRVIDNAMEELAHKGLRCIAVAEREVNTFDLRDRDISEIEREELEDELVFLGMCGIYDPPRPESLDSVRLCQAAGITVRMLTGDHPETAFVIAGDVGIVGPNTPRHMLTSGPVFDVLTPEQLDATPLEQMPCVIGRCSPMSKVHMVEALQRKGSVVAMTGDGFNDSPAIKLADIGAAMGSGTHATQSVAELIITDDNFASIVRGIAEGRRIRDSIGKFIVHLLSGNVAEVIVLVIGLAVQIASRSVYIISPVQILWLNVFTGTPPATGLTMDEPDPDMLRRPPAVGSLLSLEVILDTVFTGAFLGVSSLCSFLSVYYGMNDGPGPLASGCNTHSASDCGVVWRARTTAFVVLYLGLGLHAYNVRHPRRSVFLMQWFDNPWLWGSMLFNIACLIPIVYVPAIAKSVFLHEQIGAEWGVVVGFLALFMLCVELYKIVKECLWPTVFTQVDTAPELQRHNTIQLQRVDGGDFERVYAAVYANVPDMERNPMHSFNANDSIKSDLDEARRALRQNHSITTNSQLVNEAATGSLRPGSLRSGGASMLLGAGAANNSFSSQGGGNLSLRALADRALGTAAPAAGAGGGAGGGARVGE